MRLNSALLSLTLFAVLVLGTLTGDRAEARGLRFGNDENIQFIQDIELKGEKNEALYLGRFVTTKFFGLGYNVVDNGFVLGIKGKENSYYPLPKDRIASLQKSGLLPNPMPEFSLSLLDYAFGYSLYIVILFVGGWGLISTLRAKKTEDGQTIA